MKKLLTATIIAIAASGATASTTEWSGSIAQGHIPNGCSFTGQVRGEMTLSGNTWVTTAPAQVQVKVREVSSISVATDGVLWDTQGNQAEIALVDYSGSSMTGNGSLNVIMSIGQNSMMGVLAGNTAGHKKVDIMIDGEAKLDSLDNLVNGETYTINHTITCTQ
jgi:hypothetical protein